MCSTDLLGSMAVDYRIKDILFRDSGKGINSHNSKNSERQYPAGSVFIRDSRGTSAREPYTAAERVRRERLVPCTHGSDCISSTRPTELPSRPID